MDNAELAHLPTYRLAELIAAKEVSPVEVTQLYLDRIDALDSQLNSYLTVTAELALEAARAAEQKVASGDDLGPLHGVPIGIKDLQMTKGILTTGGSLAYKDRVPDADSAVVERVLASGVHVFTMQDVDRLGMAAVAERALELAGQDTDGLHVSFDLDVCDPAIAPGVGTPVKGGISYREAHLVMETVADSGRLRALDLVELNPTLDDRNATAELGVELVLSALGQRIL